MNTLLQMRLAQVLALVSLVLFALPARAWNSVQIQSDNVTLDLDGNGGARVVHEILLRLSGGPLKSLTIDGIDADAQLLPDATLTLAKSGSAAGAPIVLATAVDGSSLHFGTDEGSKGVRSGPYVLKFSYQTELLQRGLIRQDGGEAEVSWVGPRFSDGIDSARVLFRVPRSEHAPHLPKVDSVDGKLGIAEEYDGVFLSAVRAAEDKDELEVVRPYVAKGEPVVWRVRIDARAVALSVPHVTEALRLPEAAPPRQSVSSRDAWIAALIAAAVGLTYLLLALQKGRYVQQTALLRGVKPRSLVALGPSWRASLAGTALAVATLVLWLTPYAVVAALALVVAMLLNVYLPPVAPQLRRGPGSWRVVKVSQAFAGSQPGPPPGAWLDVGRLTGVTCLAAVLGGSFLWASRVFAYAPEKGAYVLLEALAVLPVFCTGRAAELPATSHLRSKPKLLHLLRRLKQQREQSVKLIARFQQGASAPDEARLSIAPAAALAGFRSLELALEQRQCLGHQLELPVLLLRVADGSPCYEALPRRLNWMRGRASDERVCVLRPKLPTNKSVLELTRGLCAALALGIRAPVVQRVSSSKIAGKGERAEKAPTSSSPVHAM